MPTFSRKMLRQNLGIDHLRDTIVGNTSSSWTTAPITIIDQAQADLSLSGQAPYERAWVKVGGMELRVATFNVGTGALISQMIAATLIGSGTEYERHSLSAPSEKDRCIDDTIKRLRVRREVGVAAIDGGYAYPLDGAASPHLILDVLDAYYFADPTATLNRGRGDLVQWKSVSTATGTEIRISQALQGSQQLVLDAILSLTLGAGDAATLNIPDERLVLYGAEAAAWHRLAQKAPPQQVEMYRRNRDDAARIYSDLAAKFKLQADTKPEFDTPFDGGARWNW